jgi:hypothetical protein
MPLSLPVTRSIAAPRFGTQPSSGPDPVDKVIQGFRAEMTLAQQAVKELAQSKDPSEEDIAALTQQVKNLKARIAEHIDPIK